jgi:hypothetical protein
MKIKKISAVLIESGGTQEYIILPERREQVVSPTDFSSRRKIVAR